MLKRVSKKGTPHKRRHFAGIVSYSVKTVADRSRLLLHIITGTADRFFRFVNIDDFERP